MAEIPLTLPRTEFVEFTKPELQIIADGLDELVRQYRHDLKAPETCLLLRVKVSHAIHECERYERLEAELRGAPTPPAAA